MRVFSQPTEFERGGRPVCVAIGTFDGVHLGHQELIARTVQRAREVQGLAVAVTFDRHPLAVLAPERAPPAIYPLERKLRALAEPGLDAAWVIRFDQPFSELSAADFVERLARELAPLDSICVGGQFAFGHRRAGNVGLLSEMGARLGFQTCGLPAVSWGGQPVSSTRIREAITAGDLAGASQMLGRPYSLVGTVVRGDGLGRQLGYPTANLQSNGLVLPPTGVYAVYADGPAGAHPGVLNVGYRPTVASAAPELRVEAHLLETDAPLYGQPLEITFVQRLRDEIRFPSLSALRDQIARDITAARTYFAWTPAP